jgi:hypothetical protein
MEQDRKNQACLFGPQDARRCNLADLRWRSDSLIIEIQEEEEERIRRFTMRGDKSERGIPLFSLSFRQTEDLT